MSAIKATDPYGHQKKYNTKMQADGFRRVTVWVPIEDTDALQRYAENLRKAATKR
tara:strand:- start:652 stop:816 length:165 start_codon:yes stop_codon:yes gene_type:complete